MIPKIIHYIWLGGNPIPSAIQECIDSWKRVMPDFKLMLWDDEAIKEIDILFVKEALSVKKWAFASDVVRLWALANYGGIYLDTDVEIIKHWPDEFLYEHAGYALDEGGYISVVMFSEGNNMVHKKLLDMYDNMSFVNEDGSYNTEVNNTYIQHELEPLGYKRENALQRLTDGTVLFPDDFFHCRSLTSGKLHITNNSYSIHWHTILWASKKTKFINFLRINILVPLFGSRLYSYITKKIKRNATTI